MMRIALCRFVDGNTVPTDEGAALLYGVTVEQLREIVTPGMTPADLPQEMRRKAAKRGKAARDAAGTATATACLAFWAAQEWPDSRIDFDEAAGVMFAVIEEP